MITLLQYNMLTPFLPHRRTLSDAPLTFQLLHLLLTFRHRNPASDSARCSRLRRATAPDGRLFACSAAESQRSACRRRPRRSRLRSCSRSARHVP